MKKNNFLYATITLFFVAMYISTNIFQLQLIQGNSMSPTYHNWQLVILQKNISTLNRGDVITFYSSSLDTILIKRIVATPGDTVYISNGILYVNTQASTVIPKGTLIDYAGTLESPLTLDVNQYFVLGDNIENSIDSRYIEIGCISKEDILGKVYPQLKMQPK